MSKKAIILMTLFTLTSLPILAQETDYVPGIILVKTKSAPPFTSKNTQFPSIETKEQLNTMKGIKVIDTLTTPKLKNAWGIQNKETPTDSQTHIIQVDPDKTDAIIQELNNTPWVESAEKDYYVYIDNITNDTLLNRQTYLSQTTLKQLLDIPVTSETIVAVLDTGVDKTHVELSNQLLLNRDEVQDLRDNDENNLIDDISGYSFYGYSFTGGDSNAMDYHSHGTHISGIIAAKSNNNSGISGINPSAKILNAKFLDSNGRGSQSDAARAIYYSVEQGAKIINCSWGYTKVSTPLRDAIAYAISHGVIVVAASGNDNHSIVDYPSGLEGVIGVGSVDNANQKSYFSNYGPHLDIASYGENIQSLGINNSYTSKSGTSQSTAIISGILSLIYSVHPTYTAEQALDILYKSCDDIGPPGKDVYTGNGVVNGNKLKALLLNTSSESNSDSNTPSAHLVISNLLNFPNPISSTTEFGFNANQSGTATIKIYTMTGRLIKEMELRFSPSYNTQFWDATDDSGQKIANGNYIYSIEFKGDTGTVRKKGLVTVLKQ
jgi:subtilisin family serine protease